MRDRSRRLVVVNTDPRRSVSGTVSGTATRSVSGGGGGGYGAGNIIQESQSNTLPLIAENYADGVTQLMRRSFLTNPGFADDAEGWTLTGESKVSVSDGKNRLFVTNGTATQENGLVRKAGEHYVYKVEEEEDLEGSEVDGNSEESGSEVAAVEDTASADSLVTEQKEWEAMEEPVQVEGKDKEADVLYLELSFICHTDGTLGVGFVGSDETIEGAITYQSVAVTESEEVQTVSASGTWDGVGDFHIDMPVGEVEVVSVYLSDKPLEEYRKEVDSAIKQGIQNVTRLFEAMKMVMGRMVEIQEETNLLRNNDSILYENWFESWYEMEYVLKPSIEGLTSSVNSIQETLSSLNSTVSVLSEKVTTMETNITNLDTRVTALEEAGEADGA